VSRLVNIQTSSSNEVVTEFGLVAELGPFIASHGHPTTAHGLAIDPAEFSSSRGL
jgi:hypothetical protein